MTKTLYYIFKKKIDFLWINQFSVAHKSDISDQSQWRSAYLCICLSFFCLTSYILYLYEVITRDHLPINGKSSWFFFYLNLPLRATINPSLPPIFPILMPVSKCHFMSVSIFHRTLWWTTILKQVECSFSTHQQAQHVSVSFLWSSGGKRITEPP